MKTRIEYIDTLKFIAIFAVIAIHALHAFGIGEGIEVLNLDISTFRQIFHFAVPIFLMITGALFLNKEIELKEFITNRTIRIVYPLLFFTIIIHLLQISNYIFSYYWYSWMIIGTLFAIPIINKFIQYSSEKEILYYICIFIIFSIIGQITNLFNIQSALDITFFYNPVSYLILGYYLSNKKIDYSDNKIIIFSILIFIVSSLLRMYSGSFHYTSEFHTYLDLSILQILQACSVFIFIKTIYSMKETAIYKILNQKNCKKYILSVSRASYGMYLVQNILLYIIKPKFKLLELGGTQSVILILVIAISVFFISWIIVLILSKIPILKKFSGYY